jgi:hypothetical protein
MEEKISKKIHDRSLLYQDTSLNTLYRYTIKENILTSFFYSEPRSLQVVILDCLLDLFLNKPIDHILKIPKKDINIFLKDFKDQELSLPEGLLESVLLNFIKIFPKKTFTEMTLLSRILFLEYLFDLYREDKITLLDINKNKVYLESVQGLEKPIKLFLRDYLHEPFFIFVFTKSSL